MIKSNTESIIVENNEVPLLKSIFQSQGRINKRIIIKRFLTLRDFAAKCSSMLTFISDTSSEA